MLQADYTKLLKIVGINLSDVPTADDGRGSRRLHCYQQNRQKYLDSKHYWKGRRGEDRIDQSLGGGTDKGNNSKVCGSRVSRKQKTYQVASTRSTQAPFHSTYCTSIATTFIKPPSSITALLLSRQFMPPLRQMPILRGQDVAEDGENFWNGGGIRLLLVRPGINCGKSDARRC